MAATTFPNYKPHQDSPGRKTIPRLNVAAFGDGYQQVSKDGINGFDITWELVWANEDNDIVSEIVTFLTATGGYKPFYWTPPEEQDPSLWICTKGWDQSNYKGLSQNLKVTFQRWYGAAE